MGGALESPVGLYFTHSVLDILGAGWTWYFLERELSLLAMRIARGGEYNVLTPLTSS